MPDIERRIVIAAPRERVWQAVVDSTRFGTWFGAEFDGPFVVGHIVTGRIVPTAMDAEIAATQEPHRGTPMSLEVVAIDPLTRFAFWWHPVAGDATRTIVEFTLRDVAGGVEVTITEDGFHALPTTIAEQARDGNDGGWDAQTRLLATYLLGT